MSDLRYQPDFPSGEFDATIVIGAGPEPVFDGVVRDFLLDSYFGLKQRCSAGGLLCCASLGLSTPWLYRLVFYTRGLARDAAGEVTTVHRHVVALRFLPDYLRVADRFAMLRLIEPRAAAHPSISPAGAICVEIYPGEPLVDICQSLHDLFRWRLRQYDERDALNPEACAWGRENVAGPIDDRPLFGQPLQLQWQDAAEDLGD